MPFDKSASRIFRTHIVDQIGHIYTTCCIIATPASEIIIVNTKATDIGHHTNDADADTRTLIEPSEHRSSRVSMTDACTNLYTSVVSDLMSSYVWGVLTNGISMFILEESGSPGIVNRKAIIDIGQ